MGVTKSILFIGERVRVRLVPADPTAAAAKISILTSGLSGTVSSLSGTVSALTAYGFTLTTRSGVAHAITISRATSYRQGKTGDNAWSLQLGAKVGVIDTIQSNGSMLVSSVNVHLG
jgi:hypothetical protein